MTRWGDRLAVVCVLALVLGTCRPSAPVAAEPDEPIHLLYLHGALVEGEDPRPVHPRHGVYDWPAVVTELEAGGFAVEAEQRDRGTQVDAYAARVAERVGRLLAEGVPARRIAVVGHSKGGVIALLAAARVGQPEVRYGILAGCFPSLPSSLRPVGHFLSLVDRDDSLAVSCQPWLPGQPEIVLATGRGHGLFYRPDPSWTRPLLDWLRQDSGATSP